MKSKERLITIGEIAKRAKEMGILVFDVFSLLMDLKLADEVFDLNLEELKIADDQNFSHDIMGIQNHIDRENKSFFNNFLPRFSS